MFPLTFDWSQIAYIGSPLLVPWWAGANIIGGLVIVMWIIAPILCMSISEVQKRFLKLIDYRLSKRALFRISTNALYFGVRQFG